MTLAQMQPRPASAVTENGTPVDVMDGAGLRVWDDMTVEVALSVMASARAGHLLVCDEDSQCTGVVTQTRLTAVRNDSAYTDRVRLRDIHGDSVPFASSVTVVADAEHTMRSERLGVLAVVDEHGCSLGYLSR
ncbi:CBS domain-containing protein [Streptomyces sp. NPDC002133]|uniref:CBS domain-containing protein n=1 Tax=Streptomyces sp. NPDC002133 TaxID=3154409 RepID=UPI00332C57AE